MSDPTTFSKPPEIEASPQPVQVGDPQVVQLQTDLQMWIKRLGLGSFHFALKIERHRDGPTRRGDNFATFEFAESHSEAIIRMVHPDELDVSGDWPLPTGSRQNLAHEMVHAALKLIEIQTGVNWRENKAIETEFERTVNRIAWALHTLNMENEALRASLVRCADDLRTERQLREETEREVDRLNTEDDESAEEKTGLLAQIARLEATIDEAASCLYNEVAHRGARSSETIDLVHAREEMLAIATKIRRELPGDKGAKDRRVDSYEADFGELVVIETPGRHGITRKIGGPCTVTVSVLGGEG